MRIFTYIVIGIVAAAVVLGIVLVGLPSDERARQLDQRRVSDLHQIRLQVIAYWQRNGVLPESLDALRREYAADVQFIDPETGEPYEYRPTASTTFELCATFKTVYHENTAGDHLYAESVWDHPAGRHCFSRSVNYAGYPPLPKPAATGGCLVTGCSGQVCAEKEVATTCDFRPEYACYKQYSRCERQTSGQCGWAATPELSRCLSSAPAGVLAKPVPAPR